MDFLPFCVAREAGGPHLGPSGILFLGQVSDAIGSEFSDREKHGGEEVCDSRWVIKETILRRSADGSNAPF